MQQSCTLSVIIHVHSVYKAYEMIYILIYYIFLKYVFTNDSFSKHFKNILIHDFNTAQKMVIITIDVTQKQPSNCLILTFLSVFFFIKEVLIYKQYQYDCTKKYLFNPNCPFLLTFT